MPTPSQRGVSGAAARRPSGAPLVVFVAGADARDATGWQPTLDALSPRYRVLRWQQPGASGSDPTLAAAALAKTLSQAIRAGEGSTVYLCGHGVGGITALAFAAAGPERLRGLILVDTTPEPLSAASLEALNRSTDVAQASAESAWPQSLGFLDRLEHITTPTLVVAGEADAPFFQRGAELLHGWMPFSRLVRIPHSAHEPQRENTAAFLGELTAFLHEIEASRAENEQPAAKETP
jgi:pimeloyl-ACP methyl ester carboxylesterase